jgi:hypothetical protein
MSAGNVNIVRAWKRPGRRCKLQPGLFLVNPVHTNGDESTLRKVPHPGRTINPRADNPPLKSEDLFKLNVLIHVNRRFLKVAAKFLIGAVITVSVTVKAMFNLGYGK